MGKVSGENKLKSIETFRDAGLVSQLVENVTRSKYTVPTPVQKNAIPIILASRDLMACAQTGSGKTAAFLLPILSQLIELKPESCEGASVQAPQCVVITPTRELAIQIGNEGRKFSQGSDVKVVVTYGGTSINYQASQLGRGCNILVSTPGRLLDYVEKGRVTFSSLKYLVLDEADRMLDMGFMPDIQRCVSHHSMPPKGTRQTLMFSATFPDEIQVAAMEFLHNYLFLAVGLVGGPCSDVAQAFYEVAKFDKREKLEELLQDPERDPKERTLIFVETKRNADFLATFFVGGGIAHYQHPWGQTAKREGGGSLRLQVWLHADHGSYVGCRPWPRHPRSHARRQLRHA